MPDNTNVNNNSSVVVVGRTAPVPPGQQKAEKWIPTNTSAFLLRKALMTSEIHGVRH